MNWDDKLDGSVGTAWVGDTQVTYVIVREKHGSRRFVVQRHVAGARGITTLGAFAKVRWGKASAQRDLDQVQAKGF